MGTSASTTNVSRIVGTESRSLSADVEDWNPFEDPTKVVPMTEDRFGAEFDRIRRGSQSSKSSLRCVCLWICKILFFYCGFRCEI